MISALLSLFLAASAPNSCDDSTYAEVDEGLLSVTPDAAPTDSCDWEALHVQNGESDTTLDTKSTRASFTTEETPGSAVKSIAQHQTKGVGWNDRIELQGDSLTRRQLSWNSDGWKIIAGDQNDTTMPLWPRWLPRRTLPDGWSAASVSQPFLPTSSIPQGLGAGVFSDGWKAYALTAIDPLQTNGVPPWENPWELHQFTAGASASLPWMVSTQFSETRISRNDQDSVANQLIALGIATPHQLIALNGAWMSSRENPQGGFALGTIWTQRFENSSRLQITLRQRSRTWTPTWDPTYSSDAKDDSDASTGAGEGVASLKIPLHVNDGKGSTTSEAWAAWNPEASTQNFGIRSAVEWHRRDMRFELRGMHREWLNASGSTGFHNFVSFETELGRTPEWRAGAYRIWETSSWREGLSLAADARWHEMEIRPGLQVESKQDQNLFALASLLVHWKIDRCWRLEVEGSMPGYPDFSLAQSTWRATLRYVR